MTTRISQKGMALVTVILFAVVLTALALILFSLVNVEQEGLLRLRTAVQAENYAQSGLEIFFHRWKTNGGIPSSFKARIGRGTCRVEVRSNASGTRIESTGIAKRGLTRMRRRLVRHIP